MKKPHEINANLDPYEQFIEDNFDKIEKYPVHVVETKMKQAKEAAAAYLQKEKCIRVHLSSEDLEHLNTMAQKQGLSCKMLITNILHLYSTGHLVSA